MKSPKFDPLVGFYNITTSKRNKDKENLMVDGIIREEELDCFVYAQQDSTLE